VFSDKVYLLLKANVVKENHLPTGKSRSPNFERIRDRGGDWLEYHTSTSWAFWILILIYFASFRSTSMSDAQAGENGMGLDILAVG
jgi:hypothetical protein